MSAQERPLLTIGIPTYSRVGAIRQRLRELDSVISPEVEALLIDNCSVDETWSVLQEAAANSRFLRVSRNASNLGCDVNYLHVVEQAAGRFCWLLGDDEPVDWKLFPELLRRLRLEQAEAVHLLAPQALWPDDAPLRYQGPAEFVARFPSPVYFPHLSSNIIRVDEARRHLPAGYRAVGWLHAYVPVVVGCMAGGGLSVYPLRVLCGERVISPRWRLLDGHLGAWLTMRAAFPPSLRVTVDRLESRARSFAIAVSAVEDLLGLRAPSFGWGHVQQLLRLFPVGRYPLLLLVVAAWALRVWPAAAARGAVWAARRMEGQRGVSYLLELTGTSTEPELRERIASRIRSRRKPAAPGY